MADQDFNINIRTTADTAGVAQTEAALAKLKASGVSSSVAEQLAAAGAGFDPRTGKFASITSDVAANGEKIAKSMEDAGGASLFLGANLTRARQESIILARELATGVPTTRTLSSLMGSLGLGIAAAGLAGFGLYKAITAYGDRQLQINRDLDEQLTKLTASAEKWKEIAQTATSFEDVQKVARSVLPALDEASAKFREFQNAGISGWKEYVDSFLIAMAKTVDPFGTKTGPFEKLFENQSARLAENVERTREQAKAAITLGEEYEKAFDRRKAEPLIQAISELNQKIKEQEELQQRVGKENIESYVAIGKIVENYKAQLKELIKLHEQEAAAARKEAQPLAKSIQQTPDEVNKAMAKAFDEHRAERAALVQKEREAAAIGDTDKAKSIKEDLEQDKFGRDQRKESLQRYVALQEQSGLADPNDPSRARRLMGESSSKYFAAQDELAGIYAQEKSEREKLLGKIAPTEEARGGKQPLGKEGNADVVAAINRLADLWK